MPRASESHLLQKKNSSRITDLQIYRDTYLVTLSTAENDQSSTSLSLVDAGFGKEILKLFIATGINRITATTVSEDFVFAGSGNGKVHAFSEKSGPTPVFSVSADDAAITSIAAEFDGPLLAVGKELTAQRKNSKIPVSQDGSGHDDDEPEHEFIVFYDIRAGLKPLKMTSFTETHSQTVTSLLLTHGSAPFVASGGDDGLVNVYERELLDNEDDALRYTFNCISSVRKIGQWYGASSFSAVYAITDDEQLFGWDVESGDTVLEIPQIRSGPDDDEDSRYVLIDCVKPEQWSEAVLTCCSTHSGQFELFRISTKNKHLTPIVQSQKMQLHKDMITCMAWNATDGVIFTGGDDGRIVCWNISGILDTDQPPTKRHKT